MSSDFRGGYEASRAGKPYFTWSSEEWKQGWEAYLHSLKILDA